MRVVVGYRYISVEEEKCKMFNSIWSAAAWALEMKKSFEGFETTGIVKLGG